MKGRTAGRIAAPGALILSGLTLFGCGKDKGGTGSGNHPPVIERIVAVPATVPRSGFSQFSALASDVDGDSLRYAWTAEAGTFGGTNQVRVSWRAPATAGRYQVRVIVRDQDAADSAFANIDVGSGALVVESNPPGALVYLNGSLRPGETPLQFKNLAAGDYNIQLAGLYLLPWFFYQKLWNDVLVNTAVLFDSRPVVDLPLAGRGCLSKKGWPPCPSDSARHARD